MSSDSISWVSIGISVVTIALNVWIFVRQRRMARFLDAAEAWARDFKGKPTVLQAHILPDSDKA